MHRNLLMACLSALPCVILVGCIGHPPLQQGNRLFGQPQYITVPTVPSVPSTAPGPIASPPPEMTSPDGGELILTPAARTNAWKLPASRVGMIPTTFVPIAFAPPGPRYADAGRRIDGREVGDRQAAATDAGALSPGTSQILSGIQPAPAEDLKFRGGRTIKDLTYINIYVGGQQAWNESDRKNVDWALNAAMTDPGLNHVLMQYFDGEPVTANYRGSFILDGYRPARVTQANLRELVQALQARQSFRNLPLESTAINFFFPRGVVLEDPETTGSTAPGTPQTGLANSLYGLGGYHGSVHVGEETLYYTACAYSERLANGQTNGVPVFNVPWKDICATMYHQLQDLRTNPDVDDVINSGQTIYAGWVSDRGEELSDFPVRADGADGKLDRVFTEVILSNGSGAVPVQLCYSNAVHGPEGPLSKPHRGAPLPIPAATSPPWGPAPPSTPPTPPPTTPPSQPNGDIDPALDWINAEWDRLPDSVKFQILQLIKNSI